MKENRKWGTRNGSAESSERTSKGKFAKSHKCDSCGKAVGLDDFVSDEDVCGGGDGPGFVLCERVRCLASYDGKSVAERTVLFTAGFAKGRGARG